MQMRMRWQSDASARRAKGDVNANEVAAKCERQRTPKAMQMPMRWQLNANATGVKGHANASEMAAECECNAGQM